MKNLDQYLQYICDDYAKWHNVMCGNESFPNPDEVKQKMIDEFNTNLCYNEGSKYIKVCTNNGGTVHSFIVKKDNNKFKAGDILKAASFKAPATNFARGNVIDGNWNSVRWTGA
jgi:hypothetical protein